MRWRRILEECAVLLSLLICASSLEAQTVQQSGSVTPGHAAKWTTTGVISDGGTASNGGLTSLGVTASGPGICQQSGPNTGALNRVCLNATSTSGGISMTNVGGATGGFTFTLNGVTQGMGTVTLPVTTGNFACFADTTGTLQDCGGSLTSPASPSTSVQFNAAGVFGGSANLTWVSPALSIGATSSATGQLKLVGFTSGTVTIQSQAAAGTYNFNLPTSAGTSGQPLLSGGGGAAAQTYGTLSVSGGGTGFATSGTAGDCIKSGGGTSAMTSANCVTGSTLANGAIYVGDTSNVVAARFAGLAVPATALTVSTIQASINELATFGTGGGGVLLMSPANASISTASAALTITTGSAVISGGGASSQTGTTLVTSSAANNLFSLTTINSVTMREFGISNAVTRDAGTAGIICDDTSSGDPQSKKVFNNLYVNGQIIGFNIADCFQFVISDSIVTPSGTAAVGIVMSQPDAADSGTGNVLDTKVWNVGGSAFDAGIRWNRGSGPRIMNSRILGAFDYGFHAQFNKTFGDDGAWNVSNNMFEVQDLYGIYIERTSAAQVAGTKIGQLVITGNHIQALTSGYQNAVAIESSSGGPWVQGAVISGNIIQNSIASPLNNAMIRIDSCDACSVIGNVIYNVGSGDGGIRVAGQSTNTIVAHNNFIGGTAANRYPSLNATTTLVDMQGVTFATLPSPRDGSMVYVTDGAPGAPLAGSGSGVMAIRRGSAWLAIPVLTLAQTWTGIQTFTTPVLGAATATSINGLTITACTSCTLTIANSATLQQTGAFLLNLTVTASTTPTFPTGAGTLAYLAGTNSWSGVTTFSNATDSSSSTTGGVIISGGLGVAKTITQASGQTHSWNADTYLGRAAAANVMLGQADAAAPVAQTLSVQNVASGTSNINGALFTIKGSRSTGAKSGGDILFQTTIAGSSGSSQNTLVDTLRLHPGSDAGANPVAIFGGGATSAAVGGGYEVMINGGTGNQVLSFAVGATLAGYFSVGTGGVAFFSNGAVGVQFGVNNAGQFQINSTATNALINIATASTSAATGALTLTGAGAGLGVAGAIWAGTYINTTTNTVNGLPACGAGIKGARTFVSDNNTALAFAAVITTGGTIQTPVYCDGTVWRQGANDNIPEFLRRKFA